MVVWGCDNRVAILKMVTKEEHQLIDLNTEPRLLTDREGETVFLNLWSYVKDLFAFDIHILISNEKLGETCAES
jgi:hypothetical protein